jgi:hypothetical protein
MPTFAAGHSTALLNAIASPQIDQEFLPAPPPSRPKFTPHVALPAVTRQSKAIQIAQQPGSRRLIPIDKASRTAEPEPARGFLP